MTDDISQMTIEQLRDERMILAHQNHYWKNKLWRTEQKLAKEVSARKELEEALAKYAAIPEDRLSALIQEIKEAELVAIKKEADALFGKIGLIKWLKFNSDFEKLPLTQAINGWKEVIELYSRRIKCDDECE